MSNTILGDPLFAAGPDGKLKSRIATVFPRFHAIVTLPGIHATQIAAFVEWLIGQQLPAGFPQTAAEKEKAARDDAVALTVEGETVQIRPDPANTPLAFRADRFLQTFVSKRRIKFLNVLNERGPRCGEAAGRMLADRPPPHVAGGNERADLGSANRHSRQGDLLLQQHDRHPLVDVPGVFPAGQPGRILAAAAPGRNPRVLRKSEFPLQSGNRLLHGGRPLPAAMSSLLTSSVCSMRNNCGRLTKTSAAVSTRR